MAQLSILDDSEDDFQPAQSRQSRERAGSTRPSRSRSVASTSHPPASRPRRSAASSRHLSQSPIAASKKPTRDASPLAPTSQSRRSTATAGRGNSTGPSAEPVLVSASPTPVRREDDSSVAASPPFQQLTPIEYEYIEESEQSTPGPSRGRPYVDIEFMPLMELRHGYEYADDVLTRPTPESREWLRAEQRNRPRTPVPSRLPPQRSSKVQPHWAVNSESDYEERLEEDDIEEVEDESSEDEIMAASRPMRTRRAAQQRSSSPEMVTTRSSRRTQEQRVQPSRKRRRSSSRSSNQSYVPNGRAVVESEGESEIDEIDWSGDDDDDDDEDDYGRPRKGGPLKATRAVLSKHREICERCKLGPADILLKKAIQKKKKGKKRRVNDEDLLLSDEESARQMEGWLECERCVVSSHWGCLNDGERRDVLNLYRTRFPDAPPRKSIAIDETASFTCARCNDYPVCFVCKERHVPGGPVRLSDSPDNIANGSQTQPLIVESDDEGPNKRPTAPLLFRCSRCKQAVHYEHLKSPFPKDEEYTLPELAREYQTNREASWWCHCCRSWRRDVDKIIAWRPTPDGVEPEREEGELPRVRDQLPREYLVKFKERSFRHLAWVPHAWLQMVSAPRLRNFLEKGPRLDIVTDGTLAARGDLMRNPTIADVLDDEEEQHGRAIGEQAELEAKWEGHGPPPDEGADESIPVDWSTVDRLLDVYLRPPKSQKKASQTRWNRIESSGESDEDEPDVELEDGVQPPGDQMVELSRWENMAGRKIGPEDIDEIAPLVTWVFAKWRDLQYDQSCWDTPPPVGDERYPAFELALERFLAARLVTVPVLGSRACAARDDKAAELALEEPPSEQPDCVVGGKLMPFQLEGFQWLLYKHWSRESCILGDDMGLGKTIQVCSFLGYLCKHEIYPNLVIVPNSTITNWVREFEKWVPHVRVVPYYGEQASRKIISKYELFHLGKQGKADGLKAHVVLTTYDTITSSDFRIFNNIPRWETLIVDEGQRLKSDSSLIFNKLKQLNSIHRILLTGTPLNNNLRELFNLLNFLDPEKFANLKDLEDRFEFLNERLVQELHEMLQPYILRRIKSQVLKLPPKVEIIVPISMSPAQKQLSKLIFVRSAEYISNIRKKRKQQLAAQKRKHLEAIEAAEASEVEHGIETAAASGAPSGAPSGAVSAARSPQKDGPSESAPAVENGQAPAQEDAAQSNTANASSPQKSTAEAPQAPQAPQASQSNAVENGVPDAA